MKEDQKSEEDVKSKVVKFDHDGRKVHSEIFS